MGIPGVSFGVSNPATYTMWYANGPRTYTERFALITCSPAVVAAAGGQIAGVVESVASAATAVPMVGPALAGLIGIGAMWYGKASLNGDGSVTFQFAYHYCGTKAGGADLTAWPFPGLDPNVWNGIVNGLLNGIPAFNGMFRLEAAGEAAAIEVPEGRSEGSFREAVPAEA